MKTSTSNLIAALTVSVAVLATSSASAGGFKVNFGGGGGGGGGHKHHGNHHHHHGHHHHGHHHHHKVYHYPVKRYYEPVYVVYDQCYQPYYSSCFVYPGDTWYTIAKRCYGHSHLWKHIAKYNNLSTSSSVLVPGLQLQLPVVNANGTLAVSSAPAAAPFAMQGASIAPTAGSPPQQLGPNAGLPVVPSETPSASTVPAATIRAISDEPKRPVLTLGSTLALDGQSLGSAKGLVRLRISGLLVPVDVLEWSDSSVKIKLPTIELDEAVNADLQVLRADGSLASNSAVELMPAATRLALGK